MYRQFKKYTSSNKERLLSTFWMGASDSYNVALESDLYLRITLPLQLSANPKPGLRIYGRPTIEKETITPLERANRKPKKKNELQSAFSLDVHLASARTPRDIHNMRPDAMWHAAVVGIIGKGR